MNFHFLNGYIDIIRGSVYRYESIFFQFRTLSIYHSLLTTFLACHVLVYNRTIQWHPFDPPIISFKLHYVFLTSIQKHMWMWTVVWWFWGTFFLKKWTITCDSKWKKTSSCRPILTLKLYIWSIGDQWELSIFISTAYLFSIILFNYYSWIKILKILQNWNSFLCTQGCWQFWRD